MSLKTEGAAASPAELPDTLEITLRKPVTHLETTYEVIRLREPTAGEMQAIKSRPLLEQQVVAVALISGVPEGAVKKIGIRDVTKAELYLVGFIDADQETGGA